MAEDKETQRWVVGMDAGGTSLRVAVAEAESGRIEARAEGVASGDGGPETVAAILDTALQSAGATRAEVAAVCAGITKVSRSGVRERWKRDLTALLPEVTPETCWIVPDYVAAFHGALPEGAGIAVVAGTGSVVYGENRNSVTVRVGGRGWEYGDEGSGAWLTAEMVRRTLRALDGVEKPTPVEDAVHRFLETTDAAVLAEAARQRALSEGRGFLVPLALQMAREGVPEAKNLFVGAAGWLAAYVRAAQNRLNLAAPFSVATIGGLWEAGDLLREPFETVLRRWLPETTVVAPDAPPVVGAIRIVHRLYKSSG
ncbi:MAG: BadF/BadG/BcrA/BcrD ATPase family protein [Armatimonadaceae bacterium]